MPFIVAEVKATLGPAVPNEVSCFVDLPKFQTIFVVTVINKGCLSIGDFVFIRAFY